METVHVSDQCKHPNNAIVGKSGEEDQVFYLCILG